MHWNGTLLRRFPEIKLPDSKVQDARYKVQGAMKTFTLKVQGPLDLGKFFSGKHLSSVDVMTKWAKTMLWKGIHPIVEVSTVAYEKDISLTKLAMRTRV